MYNIAITFLAPLFLAIQEKDISEDTIKKVMQIS